MEKAGSRHKEEKVRYKLCSVNILYQVESVWNVLQNAGNGEHNENDCDAANTRRETLNQTRTT